MFNSHNTLCFVRKERTSANFAMTNCQSLQVREKERIIDICTRIDSELPCRLAKKRTRLLEKEEL